MPSIHPSLNARPPQQNKMHSQPIPGETAVLHVRRLDCLSTNTEMQHTLVLSPDWLNNCTLLAAFPIQELSVLHLFLFPIMPQQCWYWCFLSEVNCTIFFAILRFFKGHHQAKTLKMLCFSFLIYRLEKYLVTRGFQVLFRPFSFFCNGYFLCPPALLDMSWNLVKSSLIVS